MKPYIHYAAAGALALAGLLATSTAHAGEQLKPLTAQCLAESAERHGVMQMELLMILHVERGTSGQTTGNSNKTYDIGLFQINSIHLKELAGYGITESMLKNDGCLNAEVAAWHLARVAPAEKLAQAKSEDEYLSLLANYHSVTPKYNRIYSGLLKNAFNAMQRQQGGRT